LLVVAKNTVLPRVLKPPQVSIKRPLCPVTPSIQTGVEK